MSALWDGFPVSPGHALLVTKRHIADWFEATDEEHSALTRALSLVKEEVERRYAPDGFNVGVSVGEAAGQTVFYLHVHLIPRYSGTSPMRGAGSDMSFYQRGTTCSWPSPEPRAPLVNHAGERVVAHVIFDFDLKFIYKRSIVHRARPTVELSFARYRSTLIFDTACEWERWSYGTRVSLDRLARVLELPSSKSDGINGLRVQKLFDNHNTAP